MVKIKLMKENKQLMLLKRQIKNGGLPHAYLFSGVDEKGKEEAIEYLLGELLQSPKQGLGQKTDLNLVWGRNPDFFEINSDPISIDDIRFLKDNASRNPLAGEKNIFLIRSIERLSWQAAPALLKLLEEPSASSFILATTENSEKILPTLRSRFSHLKFYSNAAGKTSDISSSDNKKEKFNLATKPPHEEPREFREFVRGALDYVRGIMRKNPTPLNIERTKRILRAMDALSDPTINRRLLGEYIIMVLS